MKAILRSAVLAATAATAMAMTTTSAHAHGSVVFTGTATIDCFGCGPSSGSAELDLVGEHHSGSAHATFDLNEPAGTCPATGSASGEVSGAASVTFNWTRIGATAVITTQGDINGGGTAAFKANATLACGGTNITATVAGSVSGA